VSLVALSLSHKTANLADLEKASIRPAALGDALSRLLMESHILEAAVLSTCNRTEVYAWGQDAEPTLKQIGSTLEDFQGLGRGWVSERSAVHFGDAVIHHLFLVVSGLDSMVPGEAQIQGQVRDTYRAASEIGSVGPNLHTLFRWALEAGKRARTDTALAQARRGLSTAAVEAVSTKLGDLRGKNMLMVGTGKMAGMAIPVLRERGAEVRVATRRTEVASALAARLGVSAIPIHDLEKELETTDAVVFATIAPHFVLTREQGARLASAREGRPLLVIDLGLPRNVDPEAGDLPGLDLYDLERMNSEGLTGGHDWDIELERAREIALEEARACADAFREKAANDLVSRIHDNAEEVASAELERTLKKVPDLDEAGREAVEAALRRAVRKLVHVPTVRAKEAASQGDEDLLTAARYLFGFPEESASGENASPS
jgi:glutamyl-tRNA reductase